MGGLGGHMDHLYENRDLTFSKMKEIIRAAANAELSTEEKVDGQNLYISYSMAEDEHLYVPEKKMDTMVQSSGKARGARNKGNLKAGGLDAAGLANKFAGRGGLTQAFTGGFDAFEKSVKALSDEEKKKAFGPDADIWYNVEIMDPGTEGDPNDPGSVNIIKYDNKTLKIHGVGHFLWDKENLEKKPIPQGALETIDGALERMQSHLSNTDSKFKLARKAIVQLQKMEDETVLSKSIGLINRELSDLGLNDNSTTQDYMFQRLLRGMDTDLPEETREEIVKYLLKLPGNVGLRVLKKGLSQEDLADLNDIIQAKKSLLFQAIEPLESIIHDFAVELLKGLDSVFIADTSKEVARLRQNLADAVKSITERGSEDPAAMEVMQRHLNKIKDFSQITTPVEAVVFDYDGHTYKFSGNFAPLNQILGMFKYGGRTKVVESALPSNRSILTENPGGLKREKAEQFVLSLPKFSPSEAWGDPNSMERKQIQKIFDTVGGGATIQEKLKFLNDSIENPRGGIRSPRRIISTLILMESLAAVIKSFNAASAGFVFEGFLSALFRGKQEAEISTKGNLPIQDLIAFSELDEGNSVPISLKLLNQTTNIEGSYTNLIDALDEFNHMVYIVARKDEGKNNIVLEKFTFDRDNFIDAITYSARGGRSKEEQLFQLPKKMSRTSETSIKRIKAATDWSERYALLQMTAGYRGRKKTKPEEETVTVTDEIPDGADVEPTTRESRMFSVEDNKKLLAEGLLQESSGTQWAISPAQLMRMQSTVDYEELGNLPISTDRIVDIAESYIDLLSENVQRVFKATSDLSENINSYFTFEDRSQAITAASSAIEDSKVVADEMSQQISQDSAPGQRADISEEVEPNTSGKRVALFPGKFKPPHRGHFDYVNQIAKRADVDEVLIMISPVGYPEVSNEQALSIWKTYLENGEPNIGVQIADYRSPVQAVYEFVADPVTADPSDTILLVKSSKDVGDTRFDRAQEYAEKHNPGVTVEGIVEDPIESAEGLVYSARDMRKAIADGDKETFLSYVPPTADAEDLWNTLTKTSELDREIDSVIDEISLGSAGMAGGFSLPVASQKPSKRKSSRAKVNRGKRQRRR